MNPLENDIQTRVKRLIETPSTVEPKSEGTKSVRYFKKVKLSQDILSKIRNYSEFLTSPKNKSSNKVRNYSNVNSKKEIKIKKQYPLFSSRRNKPVDFIQDYLSKRALSTKKYSEKSFFPQVISKDLLMPPHRKHYSPQNSDHSLPRRTDKPKYMYSFCLENGVMTSVSYY